VLPPSPSRVVILSNPKAAGLRNMVEKGILCDTNKLETKMLDNIIKELNCIVTKSMKSTRIFCEDKCLYYGKESMT
jgi:hypothetical protein